MELTWKEQYLDFVLVPAALVTLIAYHLFHLHRCIYHPGTTVTGFENHNRRAWVARVLQSEFKERGQAISVMSSTLSATTSLASICLALSSLIGAWIANSYSQNYIKSSIYGNTSDIIIYVKYIALLVVFLIAFVCFVQTAKSVIHANFLLSFPNCELPVNVIEMAVITASNYWVVGLRSLYFATMLLLWLFGPLPFFICSIVTVIMLYYHDKNATPLYQYGQSASTTL